MTTLVANVKPPRCVRLGRITHKLFQMERQMPNAEVAKHFLSNYVRLQRVLNHRHPFRNIEPMEKAQ